MFTLRNATGDEEDAETLIMIFKSDGQTTQSEAFCYKLATYHAPRGLTVSQLKSEDQDDDTLIMVFKSDGLGRYLESHQARSDKLDGHITSLASVADRVQGGQSVLDPGESHQDADGVKLARSLDGDTWTLSRPGLRELCFTLGGVTALKAPSPAAPERGKVNFNPMDSDLDESPLSSPPASPTSGGGPAEKASPSPDDELYPERDFEEEVSTPEEKDDDFELPESNAESEASDVEMDLVNSDSAQSEGEEYISQGDTDSGSSHRRAKTAKGRLQVEKPGSSRARPRSARSTSINKRPLEEVDDPQSGPSSGTEPEAAETDDEAASSSDDSKDETPVQKFRTVPGYGPRKPTLEEIGSEEDAVGDEESDISEEL